MITDENALAAAIAGGGPDDKNTVTAQQMEDWNQYTKWLDKRGMKGHPTLDKNNLGNNMLARYIKENPGTSLTTDSVIPIQNAFTNYRQWAINQIHGGKGEFAPGTDEKNFMKELSIVDGIPGQYTTRHEFPKEYLQTIVNNKPVSLEEKGFATPK